MTTPHDARPWPWLPAGTAPTGRRILLINADNGECSTGSRSKYNDHRFCNWPYIHGAPTHWAEIPILENENVD